MRVLIPGWIVGLQTTKMAATLAGLPQAQNQPKQQAGSASDRSLRSVFGRLRLTAYVSFISQANIH